MLRTLTLIFTIAVLGGLITSVALGYEIATSAKSLSGDPGCPMARTPSDRAGTPPLSSFRTGSKPSLPCVLLVDDDQDNPDVRSYYASALDELRATHDVWDVATQGDPSADDLMGYKMVIWFTGYPRNNTFTSANEAAVATYLDAGGCFWLVSEDYLYDRELTPFGQNRLRIRSYTNDVNRTDPEGTGEPPAPVLVSYNLIPPPGWPGELYTDNVFNSGGWGVYSPFRWKGTGQTNSTSYKCSSYRTVFFAWPLEGLADLDDRAEVIEEVIGWFGGCEIPPSETPSPTPFHYYLPIVWK